MYTDLEGIRVREMEAIAGPNEFAEFYARVKILKDAHRRNPDEEIADPEREETDMVPFTDEEGYGRLAIILISSTVLVIYSFQIFGHAYASCIVPQSEGYHGK
ncbi:unnamed protein product [Strongylus vulgaris]|uniref:Splicing factor SF3a60 binding domain-containing protein n=1 Tax=Strongylus vulgaris TaxID=40348 RepID=A0A3P7J053_STRVU|nr:unnamed protein product [Strongylus vulgaris]